MPFDSTPTTKPDVFSLEGLAAWLETEDGATEYDYWNAEGKCLIGRYLHSCNVFDFSAGYLKFANPDARVQIAGARPWTYAAALRRARALLAEGRS